MSEALSSPNAAPRDPLAEQLRITSSSAFQLRGDRDVTEELRSAICAFVRAQRDVGARAETVVTAVKRIIDSAERRSIRTPERRALTERVVTWCISEYYRGD